MLKPRNESIILPKKMAMHDVDIDRILVIKKFAYGKN